MFPNTNIHRETWKSPNENYTKQIDHILINNPFKNSITDIKTTRGIDCSSDHYLVRVKMKIRLKRNTTTKLTIFDRYDIIKFKYAKHCKRFKSEICERSRDLNIDKQSQ